MLRSLVGSRSSLLLLLHTTAILDNMSNYRYLSNASSRPLPNFHMQRSTSCTGTRIVAGDPILIIPSSVIFCAMIGLSMTAHCFVQPSPHVHVAGRCWNASCPTSVFSLDSASLISIEFPSTHSPNHIIALQHLCTNNMAPHLEDNVDHNLSGGPTDDPFPPPPGQALYSRHPDRPRHLRPPPLHPRQRQPLD